MGTLDPWDPWRVWLLNLQGCHSVNRKSLDLKITSRLWRVLRLLSQTGFCLSLYICMYLGHLSELAAFFSRSEPVNRESHGADQRTNEATGKDLPCISAFAREKCCSWSWPVISMQHGPRICVHQISGLHATKCQRRVYRSPTFRLLFFLVEIPRLQISFALNYGIKWCSCPNCMQSADGS